MKLIAIIIATTVVTASVTFVVSSTNKEVVQEERREIRNDRSSKVIAELQKQLKQAKAEAGRVEESSLRLSCLAPRPKPPRQSLITWVSSRWENAMTGEVTLMNIES